MNVELLEKAKQRILEDPRRYNLETWGQAMDPKFYSDHDRQDDDDQDYYDPFATEPLLQQRPPCGAVGCVAGNVLIEAGIIDLKVVVTGEKVYEFPDDSLELAAKALDIDEDAAMRLFFLRSWWQIVGWPKQFEAELSKHQPGTKEYAEVTGRRIDHFIKTGGKE